MIDLALAVELPGELEGGLDIIGETEDTGVAAVGLEP